MCLFDYRGTELKLVIALTKLPELKHVTALTKPPNMHRQHRSERANKHTEQTRSVRRRSSSSSFFRWRGRRERRRRRRRRRRLPKEAKYHRLLGSGVPPSSRRRSTTVFWRQLRTQSHQRRLLAESQVEGSQEEGSSVTRSAAC